MAGRARAIASAGVLQMHPMAEQNVEDRARPAVVMKRRGGRVELDNPLGVAIFKDNANFRHRLPMRACAVFVIASESKSDRALFSALDLDGATQLSGYAAARRHETPLLRVRRIFAMIDIGPSDRSA